MRLTLLCAFLSHAVGFQATQSPLKLRVYKDNSVHIPRNYENYAYRNFVNSDEQIPLVLRQTAMPYEGSDTVSRELKATVIAEPIVPIQESSLKVVTKLLPPIALFAGLLTGVTALLAPLSSPAAVASKLVFAGAVAGIISRTMCAPLEMVATVMMCRGDECVSMKDELVKTWKNEGISGMFKGNAANCLKVAPSRGTQFLVYEFMKRQFVLAGFGVAAAGSLNAGARLCAGGIAGMVAAMIVYPLEVVKTMLTLHPDECTGIKSAFKSVFRASGIGGLYRGIGPTLVAMFPYVGVEFMVYETLKKRWELAFGPAGTVALLLLGAIGGAAAQASAHPLDVIRRRMQMQGMGITKSKTTKFSNMFTGLYRVGRDEGVHVLFNGLGPACFEKIPSTAIGYYIYEAMKTALRISSL